MVALKCPKKRYGVRVVFDNVEEDHCSPGAFWEFPGPTECQKHVIGHETKRSIRIEVVTSCLDVGLNKAVQKDTLA